MYEAAKVSFSEREEDTFAILQVWGGSIKVKCGPTGLIAMRLQL